MAADFHVVGVCETDNRIAFVKVECAFVASDDPPFHCVFRFDHIEFATEGLGIGRLGKRIGADRAANQ